VQSCMRLVLPRSCLCSTRRGTVGMAPAREAASYLLTGCRVEPPVKNTFIHFNFGTNEKNVIPETEVESSVLRASYHRSHSDPVHGESSTSEHSTLSNQSWLHSLQSGRAQGSSYVTSEPQSWAQFSSPSASVNSLFSEAEVEKSKDLDSGATGSRVRLTQGSNSEAALGLPEGINSIGALSHDTDTCKPCAWNWKPGGCVNRSSCDFCHLCEVGELKRRRKERVAVLRKFAKEDRRKTAKAGAVEEGRIRVADGSDLDSGSVCATASSGHENASSTSQSAMMGFASSESSLPALAEAAAPVSPRHYLMGVPTTHLMAKKSTLISL